jgi:microcystin-dependent protein
MSSASHSKFTNKIFHNVKVYNQSLHDWVYLRPNEVGDIKYSVHSDDHNNWLKCDGRSLSRTEYSHLFDIIGTSFGSDDALTFKIPDARGRVLGTVGSGSGLTARTLGQTAGSETHTLTVNELPAHTHSYIKQNGVQTIAAASGGATTAADEPTVIINHSVCYNLLYLSVTLSFLQTMM